MRSAIVSSGVYMCILFAIPIYYYAIYSAIDAVLGPGMPLIGGSALADLLYAVLRWAPAALMVFSLGWVVASAFAVEGVSYRGR